MRWNYESLDQKAKRLAKWQKWFAWYPIRIGNNKVWLETVYRRYKVYYGPGEEVWEVQYTDMMGLLQHQRQVEEYDGLE